MNKRINDIEFRWLENRNPEIVQWHTQENGEEFCCTLLWYSKDKGCRMKVKEFIKKLKSFDPELEITVTDGFNYRFYCANKEYDYVFNEFDGKVDIGVGGMEEEHEG